MPCKEINRVPKTLTTKFGTPCATIHVNWDAFKKDDSEAQDEPNPKPKADK